VQWRIIQGRLESSIVFNEFQWICCDQVPPPPPSPALFVYMLQKNKVELLFCLNIEYAILVLFKFVLNSSLLSLFLCLFMFLHFLRAFISLTFCASLSSVPFFSQSSTPSCAFMAISGYCFVSLSICVIFTPSSFTRSPCFSFLPVSSFCCFYLFIFVLLFFRIFCFIAFSFFRSFQFNTVQMTLVIRAFAIRVSRRGFISVSWGTSISYPRPNLKAYYLRRTFSRLFRECGTEDKLSIR
jgi:hypothetical protein